MSYYSKLKLRVTVLKRARMMFKAGSYFHTKKVMSVTKPKNILNFLLESS